MILWLLACAARPVGGASLVVPEHVVIINLKEPGGAELILEIDRGVVVGRPAAAPEGVRVVDGGGAYAVPGVIDSHVHLALIDDGPARHGAAGIVAAVDLASPLTELAADHAPLQWIGAGPFVTAPGGYPTTTWGGPSYGVTCDDDASCREAVAGLAGDGARLIKISLGAGPDLSEAALSALTDEAHARGLKVAAHALTDDAAARARAAGADLLAHTPMEPLSDATVEAWRGGAVLSTLHAFGGSSDMRDNVARLRASGASVLYGTDLGNLQEPGVDGEEIDLLVASGLDGAAIVAAMTEVPARYWGFEGVGDLAVGSVATFLLVPEDPHRAPEALAQASQVWVAGAPVEGS